MFVTDSLTPPLTHLSLILTPAPKKKKKKGMAMWRSLGRGAAQVKQKAFKALKQVCSHSHTKSSGSPFNRCSPEAIATSKLAPPRGTSMYKFFSLTLWLLYDESCLFLPVESSYSLSFLSLSLSFLSPLVPLFTCPVKSNLILLPKPPSLYLLVLMLLLSNLICIHIIHPGGTPIRGKSAELMFTEWK